MSSGRLSNTGVSPRGGGDFVSDMVRVTKDGCDIDSEDWLTSGGTMLFICGH